LLDFGGDGVLQKGQNRYNKDTINVLRERSNKKFQTTSIMKPIGKVTHYYGKAGVAIVKLEDQLKLGDRIRFEKGEYVFDQEVGSMQKEYQPVETAQAGDEVGVKVGQKAPEGSLVGLLQQE